MSLQWKYPRSKTALAVESHLAIITLINTFKNNELVKEAGRKEERISGSSL